MVKKSIEENMLHTLMNLADSSGEVYIDKEGIARAMGYKSSGGAITLAIKLLVAQNKVAKLSKDHFKVLV